MKIARRLTSSFSGMWLWLALPLATNFDRVMRAPLIVGASQSADYKTESPAKVLARRFGSINETRTVAIPGRPGVEVLTQVSLADWTAASIFFGHDLFFWDSTLPVCEPSVRAAEGVIKAAGVARIPIVIGNIPRFRAIPKQNCRDVLNETLQMFCTAAARCRIFDLNGIYQNLVANKGLDYRGVHYSLRELLPDGLHLSPVAADYLADELMATMDGLDLL